MTTTLIDDNIEDDDIIDVSSESEDEMKIGEIINRMAKNIEKCEPNKLKEIAELNKKEDNNQ